MSRGKRQSIIVIGFGLIVLSGIILYYALSMPKISVQDTSASVYTVSEVSETATQITANTVTGNGTDGAVAGAQSDTDSSSDADVSVSYPLDLNTCTAEELMTINGIGEVKANNIIEYRDYLGGYTSVEQIKNIKGIGDKVYEKISPYLTV